MLFSRSPVSLVWSAQDQVGNIKWFRGSQIAKDHAPQEDTPTISVLHRESEYVSTKTSDDTTGKPDNWKMPAEHKEKLELIFDALSSITDQGVPAGTVSWSAVRAMDAASKDDPQAHLSHYPLTIHLLFAHCCSTQYNDIINKEERQMGTDDRGRPIIVGTPPGIPMPVKYSSVLNSS